MKTKKILAVNLKVGDIVRDVENPERAITLKVEKIVGDEIFMSLVAKGALVQDKNKYRFNIKNLADFDRNSPLEWNILTK